METLRKIADIKYNNRYLFPSNTEIIKIGILFVADSIRRGDDKKIYEIYDSLYDIRSEPTYSRTFRLDAFTLSQLDYIRSNSRINTDKDVIHVAILYIWDCIQSGRFGIDEEYIEF